MSRIVVIDDPLDAHGVADVLDAHGVADVLGLSHPNTVSVYQHRYEDMPRPVIDLGKGRVKLWLRPEIEDWSARAEVVDRGMAPLLGDSVVAVLTGIGVAS